MKNIFLAAITLVALTLNTTSRASETPDTDSLVDAETLQQEMNENNADVASANAFRPQPFPYPYPQPYPYPGPGIVCYAKNLRGQVFPGYGFDAFQANANALAACQMSSAVCSQIGCSYR